MGTWSLPIKPTYARPPIRLFASSTRTERCKCCNSFAALSPAIPAPTMITSYLRPGYFPLGGVQYASPGGRDVVTGPACCEYTGAMASANTIVRRANALVKTLAKTNDFRLRTADRKREPRRDPIGR